jgi:hypothetical protein
MGNKFKVEDLPEATKVDKDGLYYKAFDTVDSVVSRYWNLTAPRVSTQADPFLQANAALISARMRAMPLPVLYSLSPVGFALTGGTYAISKAYYDTPSLGWLISAGIVMARMTKEEAVMVVPLMKGGQPVIARITYNDPSTLWKSFKGDIKAWVDDAAQGIRDGVEEYERFGTAVWRRTNIESYLDDSNADLDLLGSP